MKVVESGSLFFVILCFSCDYHEDSAAEVFTIYSSGVQVNGVSKKNIPNDAGGVK